jgi:ABC-type tungstate transport system permease subunit
MCLANPEKNQNLKFNQEYARKFYDFCLSEKGQGIVAAFGAKEYGEPVYFIFKKEVDRVFR